MMGSIRIRYVDDPFEKKMIMKKCDPAFPIRLFDRDNAEDTVNKILRYAEFYVSEKKGTNGGDEAQTAGYVAYYANDQKQRISYITSIGVLKEYQHNKIGSKLLKTAIADSYSKGMTRIRLEVLNENQNAIGFYRHHGFEFEEGYNISGSGETSYMIRNLTEADV